MRWLFLILSLGSAAVAFFAEGAGTMGLAMLGTFGFGFIAVLAFAQARIEATSQSHATVLGAKDVQMLRQQGLQKKVANSRAHQQGAIGDGVNE